MAASPPAPTAGRRSTSARPPPDADEPDAVRARSTTSPTGASRVITLNRPHADNAITTEMGARLTEVLETIAVRTAVRVVDPHRRRRRAPSRSAATCASARA